MKPLSEVLFDDSASAAESGSSEEEAKRRTLKKLASDVGAFLARLYSATSNPPERRVSFLTTSSDHDSFHDYLAKVVLDDLLQSKAGLSPTEARALVDRVRLGLEENANLAGEEMCLGMVDFWPGNVLIDIGESSDKDGDEENTNLVSPKCGLVDWEDFGPSNAASELGMFLAHLHIHMLTSTTSTRTKERIQGCSEDIQPSNAFRRRALLSYGCEMLSGVILYEAKLDDAAKWRILAAGVGSLRAAGSSTDELDLGGLRGQYGSPITSDGPQLSWPGFVAWFWILSC